MKETLLSTLVTEKPNVKWEDVAGLFKAKEALKECVVLPMMFPQLFEGRALWKGILLYGPPGTGKSYLAKACATEAKSTFYSVSASNIVSKWMGESEKLVRALFDLARSTKPSVIFIDEIDSLMTARSEGENEATRRLKTEFLVQMQGVGNDETGILVLGATNIPWALDPAVRRRFQKKIYIPLPDYDARISMLKMNIKRIKHNLTEDDFKELCKLSDGFSGSDLSTLNSEAIMEPVRKCVNSTHFRKVGQYWHPCNKNDEGALETSIYKLPEPHNLKNPDVCKDDFIKALDKIKATVSKADLENQIIFTKEFGQEG